MKQIPLTKGQFALVDDEDFDRVNQFKWYADKRISKKGVVYYYAARRYTVNGKSILQRMHSFIFGDSSHKKHIDHKDSDRLNNQKYNLRFATPSENGMNIRKIGKYKGIFYYKATNKFSAQIMIKYNKIHLGYFNTEIEAAKAYDKKAIELFGEFANLNFK